MLLGTTARRMLQAMERARRIGDPAAGAVHLGPSAFLVHGRSYVAPDAAPAGDALVKAGLLERTDALEAVLTEAGIAAAQELGSDRAGDGP